MIARQTRAAGRNRPAYTLLEMTLALAIALIILGAAYEFLNRQITLAELGREIVAESASARRILDRIASDIRASLGGVDPKQLPEITTTLDDGTTQVEPYVATFNTGIEGTSTVLIISASRVPRELLAPDKRNLEPAGTFSDLRRISYWFVSDGGVARQELTGVTTSEFSEKPPDVEGTIVAGRSNDEVIAFEVANLQFEYFDGASWLSEWNGVDLAADGATPIGPPSAIRVILSVKSRDGLTTTDYRITVAIPAGNNFPSQQTGS